MGLEKFKRPLLTDGERSVITAATSASTLVGSGVFVLETTSTGAATVFTLGAPAAGGGFAHLKAQTIASSSVGPIRVKLAAGSFDGTRDQVDLSSQGAGCIVYVESTDRSHLFGNFGATLSTST